MQTHEVPTDQWPALLDTVTRLHRGERVDVETVGGGAGIRSSLRHRPLIGIVAVAGSEQGTQIEVIAGAEDQTETHTIRAPSRLSVTESGDGYPLELQIAANDGSVTALRFEPPRAAKPPENFLG
jgi:hypothetical protein